MDLPQYLIDAQAERDRVYHDPDATPAAILHAEDALAGALMDAALEDNDDEVATSIAEHEDGTGHEDRALDIDDYAALWGDDHDAR